MAKKEKEPKKMGRPLKEIDIEQFEKLCALQCTKKEIASWFNCDEDTVNNWCKRTYNMTFSAIYEEKREMGKISLRRSQWKLAEKNASMAIWLGKQYLDQRDETTVNQFVNVPTFITGEDEIED